MAMPKGLAEDAPIRQVEFIDPNDPEWKDYLDLIDETVIEGVGLLREDTENHNITVIAGRGSVNLLAEQRKPLKEALLTAAKAFPEVKRTDLGHLCEVRKGYIITGDGEPEVDNIHVHGIGDLNLTPAEAKLVAEVL